MVKLKLVAVVHTIEYSSAALRYITMFSKASSWKFLPRNSPPASTAHVSSLKFVCSNSYHWILFSNADTYLNIYFFKIHILKILSLWSSHFSIHFLNSSNRKLTSAGAHLLWVKIDLVHPRILKRTFRPCKNASKWNISLAGSLFSAHNIRQCK